MSKVTIKEVQHLFILIVSEETIYDPLGVSSAFMQWVFYLQIHLERLFISSFMNFAKSNTSV